MDDFEEAIIKLHQNPITFEQYERQNDYDTQYMRKSVIISDDKYDEHQDALDEMKLHSTVNKCRVAKNNERIRTIVPSTNGIEEEITVLLQKLPFKLGKQNEIIKWSKERSVDEIPVVGKRNTYLTPEFFKFDKLGKSASENNTSSG